MNNKRVAAGLLIAIAVFTVGIIIFIVTRPKRPTLPVVRVETFTGTYALDSKDQDLPADAIKQTKTGFDIETEFGTVSVIEDEIFTATDEKGKIFTYRDMDDIKRSENPVLITKGDIVFEIGVNTSTIQETGDGYHVILNNGGIADISKDDVNYVKLS